MLNKEMKMDYRLKLLKYGLGSAFWTPVGLAAGAFSRRAAVEPGRVSAVAVLRTGALGDVVMSTPMLRRVRELFPRARVTYYTYPPNEQLLLGNPHVDRLGALTLWRGADAARRRDFVEELRAGNYDVAFFLDTGGPWTHLLGYKAGIPARVGFDDGGRGALLTHRVRKGLWSPGWMGDWYLEMLDFFGPPVRGRRMELFFSARDAGAADDFLRENGVAAGDFLVAVFPGGGVNPGGVNLRKRWPAERFAALAERLGAEHGARAVVVGADSDFDAAAPALRVPGALNAVGRFSLLQTAALMSRCRVYVGNDSAPLHIAAAVGTPTVGIFGPTRAERLAPRGPGCAWVGAGRRCSPCYFEIVGAEKACGSCDCMDGISVEAVVEAVKAVVRSL